MLEDLASWISDRPSNPPGFYKLASFLIFSTLASIATLFFPRIFVWVFIFLVVLDGIGIFAVTDFAVSANRAFFFIVVSVFALVSNYWNIFLLTIEVLGLFAIIDFSLLLRKLDGTNVEGFGVLVNRLRAYSRTVVPAFLLTYLFFFFFSYYGLALSSFESLIIFGLASAGAFFSVYALVRYLLSLAASKSVR